MYLDLFDELRLNKRLVKIAGFEVAAYWAELQSILKQVVKKQTMDEKGFFILDREFMERETTLTVSKQLKCEEKLIDLGVFLRDPTDPNKISIAVPADAIQRTDYIAPGKKLASFQIDAGKCVKCGACVATCKFKAIIKK